MFLTKILKFEQNKSLFKENGEDWQIFKLLWGCLGKLVLTFNVQYLVYVQSREVD